MIWCINPTMHQSYTPRYTILWQKCAHMCIFLLRNGALWNICKMHCGIIDLGLFLQGPCVIANSFMISSQYIYIYIYIYNIYIYIYIYILYFQHFPANTRFLNPFFDIIVILNVYLCHLWLCLLWGIQWSFHRKYDKTYRCNWWIRKLMCQKQASRAGTGTYIP